MSMMYFKTLYLYDHYGCFICAIGTMNFNYTENICVLFET